MTRVEAPELAASATALSRGVSSSQPMVLFLPPFAMADAHRHAESRTAPRQGALDAEDPVDDLATEDALDDAVPDTRESASESLRDLRVGADHGLESLAPVAHIFLLFPASGLLW